MVIKPLPKWMKDDENNQAVRWSTIASTVDQLVDGYNRHEQMLKTLEKLAKLLGKLEEEAHKEEQDNEQK